jgi:hypothetical protein
MGDTRPIRQHPLRFLLAKQADVNEMLDDMKQRRMTEKSEPFVVTRRARPRQEMNFCVYYRR